MFSKMEAESKTRRGQKERERQEELQAQVCVCVCVCVCCVCVFLFVLMVCFYHSRLLNGEKGRGKHSCGTRENWKNIGGDCIECVLEVFSIGLCAVD